MAHQHAHQHEDKFVAANREHYNKHEENIPDPRWVELASRCVEYIIGGIVE